MPFLLKLKAEIDRVLSHLTPPLVATPMVIKPMCHLSPPLSGSSFQRLAVSFPLTSPLTPLSPIHSFFPYRRSSNGGMVRRNISGFKGILFPNGQEDSFLHFLVCRSLIPLVLWGAESFSFFGPHGPGGGCAEHEATSPFCPLSSTPTV